MSENPLYNKLNALNGDDLLHVLEQAKQGAETEENSLIWLTGIEIAEKKGWKGYFDAYFIEKLMRSESEEDADAEEGTLPTTEDFAQQALEELAISGYRINIDEPGKSTLIRELQQASIDFIVLDDPQGNNISVYEADLQAIHEIMNDFGLEANHEIKPAAYSAKVARVVIIAAALLVFGIAMAVYFMLQL